MNLLPRPRSLKILHGTFALPKSQTLSATKVVHTNSAPKHLEGCTLIQAAA